MATRRFVRAGGYVPVAGMGPGSARSVGAFQSSRSSPRWAMRVQHQRDEGTGGTDELDFPGGQPPEAEVEVRNTAAVTSALSVVQAHTIAGGIHHHHPLTA